MHAADFLGAVEIGQRARDAQHAMITARRQAHGIGRIAQQREPGIVGARDVFQDRTIGLRIDPDIGEPELSIARGLDVARAGDAGGDLAATFRPRRQNEVGGGDRRHFDVQIDAVEQRAGQAALIIGDAARVGSAAAGEARIVGAAAAAGVIAATSMKRAG